MFSIYSEVLPYFLVQYYLIPLLQLVKVKFFGMLKVFIFQNTKV